MTAAATRTRRSALWHRFYQAIDRNTSNLARTDAVMHVRDAELDRLLNQVTDYEQQLERLAAENGRLNADLTDALAEIIRLKSADTPKEP